MNEVTTYEHRAALTAVDIRAHVNLVQEVMQAVMKKDTHYGTIPGTPKPTLYKAGCDVLAATFRIAVSYRTEDLSTADVVRYRVTAIGTHQTTGITMGEGMGECSSGEEKYKWRKASSIKEFEAAPEDRRRVKYGRDYSTNQVRTDPADLANTVLKMACKRAQVAMTLNVTAASDIFTQDIEDLPEGLRPGDNDEPTGDLALIAHWTLQANNAADADALTAVWKDGVKAIQAAKDKAAYAAFKKAVEEKAASFKVPA